MFLFSFSLLVAELGENNSPFFYTILSCGDKGLVGGQVNLSSISLFFSHMALHTPDIVDTWSGALGMHLPRSRSRWPILFLANYRSRGHSAGGNKDYSPVRATPLCFPPEVGLLPEAVSYCLSNQGHKACLGAKERVTIPHLFRPLINTHFLGKPLGWLGFFGCV
jgi:hypothetical protein